MKVGDKIKFKEEKQRYTIQACNERYLICTKPNNRKRTVIYTIVDLQDGIRGTENLIFCVGFETKEDCEKALQRLVSGETEISHRNRITLNIDLPIKNLCNCGCGKETKGKNSKFVTGHNLRIPELTVELRTKNAIRMMGNTIWVDRKHNEDTKKIMVKNQTGETNSNWKGGIRKAGGGYIYVICPDHPYMDVNRSVKQERLVMEEYLGRYLDPFEIVHHINRIPDDNRLINLELCCHSSHITYHRWHRDY